MLTRYVLWQLIVHLIISTQLLLFQAGNPFFDCPVAKQFVMEQEDKYLLRENFTVS